MSSFVENEMRRILAKLEAVEKENKELKKELKEVKDIKASLESENESLNYLICASINHQYLMDFMLKLDKILWTSHA